MQSNIVKERRYSKKICKNLMSYFREYCNSTSIHGFRYFGEKRTYIERGWWIIVFVICLSGCAYLISLVYMKWEHSPVIVSFSTKETPIYKIPFPAVTICPETKTDTAIYSHSKLVKKLRSNEKLTLKEYRDASYMNLICEFNISEPLLKEYERYEINATFDNYYYADNEFFDFLYNVTPFPRLFFFDCKWMNRDIRCKDHFQAIMTDEGICYTFNMLELEDIYSDNVFRPNIPFSISNIPRNVTWSLDDGYKENEEVDTYPRRALLSGVKNALDLSIVELSENIDYTCKLSIQGFKISLHTPMRIPRPSQQYYRVPLNEVVLTAVQPVMITTSETVKVFKFQKRECFFQNEKPLKYFKHYSQQNCNLECLTNFTYYWCECVNFFMPRENGTDICGALSLSCMDEATQILEHGHLTKMLGTKRQRKNATEEELEMEEVPDCNCLPLCTDLNYDVETSASQWDWQNLFEALNESLPTDELRPSVSRLIIYFKNSQFVTSKRHELYGPTDFLGNFGGLLGLFTGFSMLSLMEIIYFLTVRIFCNIRLYGNWSGSEH